MSVEENQAVVRQWIDARNAHDVETAVMLWAEERREGLRRSFMRFSTGFPDLHLTINDMIAENDKVVVYWTLTGTHQGTYMDVPATGNAVTWNAIDLYTLSDGKIKDLNRGADSLNLLQQLGVKVSW